MIDEEPTSSEIFISPKSFEATEYTICIRDGLAVIGQIEVENVNAAKQCDCPLNALTNPEGIHSIVFFCGLVNCRCDRLIWMGWCGPVSEFSRFRARVIMKVQKFRNKIVMKQRRQ